MTSGPYRISRHPSYFGWWMWAVGTQLMLSNWFCTVLWWLAAHQFFKTRIPREEFYLLEFFGDEYIKYAKNVPILIPFIKGYLDK